MRILLFVFIIIFSCDRPDVKRITEQEVKDKFYEFFDVLSVKNPDKTKLYDLVTDDYFIFENQKKYLREYNQLENKYTKAMFTGRTNPANFIWSKQFKKIIEVMDTLGWHE